MESRQLQIRLRNCLQTILELETDLERLHVDDFVLKEFQLLKSFLSRVDDVRLDEADVRRIETATENFLKELKTPLSSLEKKAISRRRMVH